MLHVASAPSFSYMSTTEAFDTIVIGGGQAGLAVGYHLARRGKSFTILDAHPRVGDAWRQRWDSLILFTPARQCGLPAMKFPASGDAFVTKDQMADFLEAYAQHFQLPVRTGIRVDRLSKPGGRFLVQAGDQAFEADNVVVATSDHHVPRLPAFAAQLNTHITQLHSTDYKNPSQLQDGPVLIVGVGNSGADIALEVARTHPTLLAGRESGTIPFRIDSFVARHLLTRVVRFVFHHVLTIDTPMGRKARPKMMVTAPPLVRVKPSDLLAAGVQRVPRVVGVQDGLPLLEDQRVLEPTNVIWCTGFQPGFSWIDLPIFDAAERPLTERGVVPAVPGLYFNGLTFQYALSSGTILGIDRDAQHILKHMATARDGSAQRSASAMRSTPSRSGSMAKA
jgi:putative flavoprotein involved in K+ transport